MKEPFELFGKETPAGWDSIVVPLILLAQEKGIPIAQVKEKFGGLRFYHGGWEDEEFCAAVALAEENSYTMCNVCGAEGKVLGGGWLLPFCEEHAKLAGREWK